MEMTPNPLYSIYPPIAGVRYGAGWGRSAVICLGCRRWIEREIPANEWPETVECECGRVIRTKEAKE